MAPMVARTVLVLTGATFVLFALAVLVATADPFGAGVSLLLGAALIAVGMRLGKASPADAAPRATTAPVPPVEEDAVAGLREPITACPQCGYVGIKPLGLGEGGIPGVAELSDKRHCPRCGYQGLAITFRTRDDYRAFLDGLARLG